MPAYFDTGFSVREPMWHGEGIVLADYPTDWADARVKAGLMWEPRAVPTYQRLIIKIDDLLTTDQVLESSVYEGTATVFRPLEDHKLIERDDTGGVLGVVGQGLELVLHSEMGEVIEAILGEGAKFETAGSCKGGAAVWALAYLDEPYQVAGDDSETYPFLALLNNHGGAGAAKLVKTQVRVQCWNTYQAAEMEGQRTGMEFSFRHTASVHDRLEEAKQALSGLREAATEWTKLAEELFGMPVNEVQFNHFLADFIPEPPAEVVSKRVRENVDTARRAFRHLYLDSPTGEAHRGTALGLIDASVEYLDHVRGYRNRDTLMGRTLLRPEPLKAKAVMLAREVCAS